MNETLGFCLVLGIALTVPHRVPMAHAAPVLAMSIWLLVLCLRALTVAFGAVLLVWYLAAGGFVDAVSRWCLHAVLPLVSAHLDVEGHQLGDAALLAPSMVLGLSLLSVLFGLWRATRRVRRVVQAAIGTGPGKSVLLSDGDVMVAAAGLRHPRVLVSAGALATFDDEELAASLDHERGHIVRHHRYVFLAAELCRALGRFLPGTGAAFRELVLHIERDADRYALCRCHDPAALASAICKAAQSRMLPSAALSLSGGSVSRRVNELLDGRPTSNPVSTRFLAAALAAMTIMAALALPAATHAGVHAANDIVLPHHCAD